MPWFAEWHDEEERILEIYPVDPWSWDDFKGFAGEMRAQVESKPHKVHLIFRFREGLTLPQPSTETDQWTPPWMPIRDEILNEPVNRGLAVIVAAPLFMESIMATVKSMVKDQMTTDHIHFVKTMEEAERILAQAGD